MQTDRDWTKDCRVQGLPKSAAERTELLYAALHRLEAACEREQALFDALSVVDRSLRIVRVDSDGTRHYHIDASYFDRIGHAVRDAMRRY
jgi:hypothetical protein